MPDPNDDVLDVPAPEVLVSVPEGGPKVDDKDYGLLKMHALNGAQRQSDGAGHYAENLRYDYLEGKATMSFPESLGARYIQGPHPQHGSPDNKTT